MSRDASEEIAQELRQRCADRGEVPGSLMDFLERHGHHIDIQLAPHKAARSHNEEPRSALAQWRKVA